MKTLGLKSTGLESSWLKGLGLKLGVEKSGVEMFFNLPRAGNPGNVLLTSRNPPKYFYQCLFLVGFKHLKSMCNGVGGGAAHCGGGSGGGRQQT